MKHRALTLAALLFANTLFGAASGRYSGKRSCSYRKGDANVASSDAKLREWVNLA